MFDEYTWERFWASENSLLSMDKTKPLVWQILTMLITIFEVILSSSITT